MHCSIYLALACLCGPLAAAQQTKVSSGGCAPLPIPEVQGQSLFTPEQEQQFGDIFADYIERNFRVIEDDALTGRMQEIVDRLDTTISQPRVAFRVFLADLPSLNA